MAMAPGPVPACMPKAKPGSKPDASSLDAKRYPNLAAERAWDREENIKGAMAGGMTRAQAERHADSETHDD